MARVIGVDLPRDKRVEIGLQAIYGIGPARAMAVLGNTNIDPNTRVRDLTEEQANVISSYIQNTYKVEGDLRREVSMNIKRLMDLGCYRGIRHRRSLPLRGQRTKTNARTRKGPRKPIRK